MNSKRIGVIARWGEKGFGFIQDVETGTEHFCHVSCVEGQVNLVPGTRVEFEHAAFKSNKSGTPAAVFVRPLPKEEGGR
jgi:cold shock CspA family protein